MNFKAKDLHYGMRITVFGSHGGLAWPWVDASQPAFLRRLRGEIADDSARHGQPIPHSKQLKQDDEDDAPTYLLEETNQLLSKAEYETLVARDASKEKEKGKDAATSGTDEKPQSSEIRPARLNKEHIVEAGKTSKKRKAAKVIGEKQGQREDKSIKIAKMEANKKSKKKAKPAMLSFGDQQEVWEACCILNLATTTF